jgi:hypothetical protein
MTSMNWMEWELRKYGDIILSDQHRLSLPTTISKPIGYCKKKNNDALLITKILSL